VLSLYKFRRERRRAPIAILRNPPVPSILPFPTRAANARSKGFDKFYRLFQFFSKKRSTSVDKIFKRRRVEKKSTECDLRGADAVRAARSPVSSPQFFANVRTVGRAACFSPNLRPTLGRVGRFSFQRRISWRRPFFALTFAERSFRRSLDRLSRRKKTPTRFYRAALDACASSQRER